jgi:hypothetical protein
VFAFVGCILGLDFEVPLAVLIAKPEATSDSLAFGTCEGALDAEDGIDDDGGTLLLSVAHCSSDPGTLRLGVWKLGIGDVNGGGALLPLPAGSF